MLHELSFHSPQACRNRGPIPVPETPQKPLGQKQRVKTHMINTGQIQVSNKPRSHSTHDSKVPQTVNTVPKLSHL